MNEQINPTPAAIIAERQRALGLDDEAVARATGYKPTVIAMIKVGSMRLPINKVPAFAQVLKVDAVTMLRAVMMEASPELWRALDPLLPLGELAPAEVNLIRHLRRLAAGRAMTPVVLEGTTVVALVVAQ